MRSKRAEISSAYILRLELGDDLYAAMTEFVVEKGICAGSFHAIGALSRTKVGIFEHGAYRWEEHEGELEISSLNGNISLKEGRPFIHCHGVFSDPGGIVLAGHVAEGCIVDPTAEVHLIAYEGAVERKLDSDIGLWLLEV